MNATCIDVVFGEMTYKHRWFKEQSIKIFAKEWAIIVAAKAYSGKPITEAEQNSYKRYMDNEENTITLIEEQLKQYINGNLSDLSEYWMGARRVESAGDLASILTPRTLLFTQDGTSVMLFDCAWDIENGVAVRISPEMTVGSPDCFL